MLDCNDPAVQTAGSFCILSARVANDRGPRYVPWHGGSKRLSGEEVNLERSRPGDKKAAFGLLNCPPAYFARVAP